MIVPMARHVTIVLVVTTTGPAGMSMPNADSSIFSNLATPMPLATPASDETRPTTSGFDEHRTSHLTVARSERSQQGHLLLSLGDDDREGVEDDERTDEQGDDGEDHQEGVEERQTVLHVTLCLGGDLGTGQHLCAGRQDLGDVALDLVLRHAVGGDDGDGVDLPGLGDERPLRWWRRRARRMPHPSNRRHRRWRCR